MIELKEVTKQFDDFKVLDKISLTIPKGAAFGLLGSNGAGKSTILRLISGIYSAEEGEVTADNQNIYDNPAIKERIFFINDETIQFTNFTLEELKNYYRIRSNISIADIDTLMRSEAIISALEAYNKGFLTDLPGTILV